MGTATHGSSHHEKILSGAVSKIEMVTADGSMRTFNRGEENFRGAGVSVVYLVFISDSIFSVREL
jgi:xylitol oxidase